jgi:hypothetical protein
MRNLAMAPQPAIQVTAKPLGPALEMEMGSDRGMETDPGMGSDPGVAADKRRAGDSSRPIASERTESQACIRSPAVRCPASAPIGARCRHHDESRRSLCYQAMGFAVAQPILPATRRADQRSVMRRSQAHGALRFALAPYSFAFSCDSFAEMNPRMSSDISSSFSHCSLYSVTGKRPMP